jgi:predicted NBD/HSP70 family sugar kinase
VKEVTLPDPMLGNRKLIRDLNRTAVLNIIKERGAIGRAEIARESGLSPATITSLTNELIKQGLIFEADTGESSGGRKPVLLSLNPHGGFAVGVKVTEDNVIGALIDMHASVVAKRTDKLKGHQPEEVSLRIVETVLSLIEEAEVPKKRVLGLGVGLAGVVDTKRGISRQQPFFGWRDVYLGDMLQKKLHMTVMIDNDVNTLTLAEHLYGAGQGIDNFLTVTVGRGIGLGIVLDGRLFRGSRGAGGELGHTVVEGNDLVCDCGKRGCLETIVGKAGLLGKAAQAEALGLLPSVHTIDDLISLAQNQHAEARIIFAKAGDALGKAIANLINLFNPTLILISGEGIGAGDLLFEPMRASVEEHVMPPLQEDTKVRIDPMSDDAWAVGAASLILNEVFSSPVHRVEGAHLNAQ